MKIPWPWIALAVTTLASVALLWGLDAPLGVPGEWTWPRIPISAETVAGWCLAVGAAALYVGFGWLGERRLTRCRRAEAAGWLTALIFAAFAWLWMIQSAVPGIAGLAKVHFVLYYPRSSGYFWQARYEVTSTREFVAGYEELLAQRDYLHIGTHPPGLTAAFRGLLWACQQHPGCVDVINRTQPADARESFETIRSQTHNDRPYTQTDAACVWLGFLIVQALAAATVVPLYLVLRRSCDRATAWRGTVFWPLVPAVAVFLPKSDALYPFLAMLTAWLWMEGWSRRAPAVCALAGLTVLAGLLLSLAFVPVAAILAAWTFFESRATAGVATAAPARVGGQWCLAGGAAAFMAPIILLRVACGLNLVLVWSWNFSNHALFYEHNVRTWWKWLLVNPVELAVAVGPPLAVLAMSGFVRAVSRAPRSPVAIAVGLVWGLLWISGKNMGEAARLWILLMPWIVWLAAALCPEQRPASGVPTPLESEKGVRKPFRIDDPIGDRATFRSGFLTPYPGPRQWLAVLVLQCVACIATVTRIDGFQFEELAPPPRHSFEPGLPVTQPEV